MTEKWGTVKTRKVEGERVRVVYLFTNPTL